MFKEKLLTAIEAVEKEAREYLASEIILQGGSLQYEWTEEVDEGVYFSYDKLILIDGDIYATKEGVHKEHCLYDNELCQIASDIYYQRQKERE